MADDLITIQRIQKLHPKVRNEVLQAYRYVNEKLLGKGVRLRFAYTYRTLKEQDDIYAEGRTKIYNSAGKRLGIVTWAKGGQSIHNYGLAFDIVLLVDKNNDGVFETASWDTKTDYDKDGTSDWMEVINYFKSIGWVWGGDWSAGKNDPPHLEKTFGYNWQGLQNTINAGKLFRDNDIVYAKI